MKINKWDVVVTAAFTVALFAVIHNKRGISPWDVFLFATLIGLGIILGAAAVRRR